MTSDAVGGRRGWPRHRLFLSTIISLLGLLLVSGASPAVAAPPAEYNQTYRPQFHYTPAKNWMNDPNGLVYYKASTTCSTNTIRRATTWGNMCWGHASEGSGALGRASGRHPIDLQPEGSRSRTSSPVAPLSTRTTRVGSAPRRTPR